MASVGVIARQCKIRSSIRMQESMTWSLHHGACWVPCAARKHILQASELPVGLDRQVIPVLNIFKASH